MAYYLGVDGGQSSTTALIGDATGRVAGVGRGGPCNHVRGAEARAKFMDAVGGCIRAACEQAGMEQARFESAVLGFSGGPADKEVLVHELIAAGHLLVTHDALTALVGACAGEPGIVTIAGTGSIAFGRNGKGVTARAGGWGYIFGDEGGAFDIVRQAVRAALRQDEGWGPETSLRDALLEETGAKDADDLMHRFYNPEYPRSRVATLSKIVDREAIEGDPVAREILRSSAGELARIAFAVRRQLFHEGECARVSYAGGVFRSLILRAHFRELVEREAGNVFGPPSYAPAAGALIEAYRQAGRAIFPSGLPESEK
jgi:N-acetylglucosamine kinase-like BadF-type ATPase